MSTADSQGDFLLPLEGLSIGNHNITLTVTDQYGLECSDQVFITLNVPPRLNILAPTTGSRFNIGELVTFELTIQDEEDPANTIPTTITSSAGVFNHNTQIQMVLSYSQQPYSRRTTQYINNKYGQC